MEDRNEGKEMGNKKFSLRFVLLGIGLVVLLLIVGFFLLSKNQEQQEVIEHVLTAQFSEVDPELIRLLESTENISVIGNNENFTPKEDKELEQYLEQEYKPYLTEAVYEKYITAYFLPFKAFSYYANVNFEIKDLVLKKSDHADGTYRFTIHLSYAEQEELEVLGLVNVNEENKISYLEFTQDAGLFESIDR
ncbi:hypothetical protein [Paraliobacillus salinarum]|uniref:hypothetical protein n=1 Tax=Paraliobacillus salinarum TaxID=1158996 RepID=UPI0015F5765B|nr:hypothetical protein [Paraliobacillus salinarum]